MIKVQCVTNLDDYQCYNWPTALTCKPAIGEWVHTNDNRKCLKVIGIRHKTMRRDNFATDGKYSLSIEFSPYLEIELNR
jgi:hypothetical protein